MSIKSQASFANLCYGRPCDEPVDLSAGRESRLSDLMSGGLDTSATGASDYM
eukprot:SAG22_NODE_1182_length_5233_cov_12.254188_2_plen_52_part_00